MNNTISKIGTLYKMNVSLVDTIAQYHLKLSDELISVNDLIGHAISMRFTHEIICSHCGNKTKKAYSGGHCYPCSLKLASCDLCILKPELCHYAAGSCREPKWGEEHCMIPHFVYLANSSGLKVGITRHTQIPTRWIDQGASSALPIIQVNNRLQSGMVEKLFSSEVDDKTDWRKMLKGPPEEIDLSEKRDELFELLGNEIDQLVGVKVLDNEKEVSIKYPVLEYPQKVTSLSFDKTELIKGKLLGIKGQYLILDCGVLNIRNHTSYKIQMEF
jgi:hypothetical protein